MRGNFQYPTTGRGLCHGGFIRAGKALVRSFNTLPRVVGCVTDTLLSPGARQRQPFNTLPRVVGCVTPVDDQVIASVAAQKHPEVLSIPYHGSWAVSPVAPLACVR